MSKTKVIKIGDLEIGGDNPPLIIAGPCAVESREQIIETAIAVKEAGANVLRGGAYKPRSNPRSFQGLEERGLQYLADARERTGLPIVTEVTSTENIHLVREYANIMQIGSRNMQNFDLLKKIGQRAPYTPVLLKRGMTATKEELLSAIDYLLEYGHCGDIMICERGIRSAVSEGYSRNILDLNLVADLKATGCEYPVIVDPSHAAGRIDLIDRLSYSAISAGADGLIVECHLNADQALCDPKQQITPQSLTEIVNGVRLIYETIHRAERLKNDFNRT